MTNQVNRLLAISLGLLVLSACSVNKPKLLTPLGGYESAQSVSNHENYEKFDAFSFSHAVALYPASNGHHTIQVGNYLMQGLMNAFSEPELVTSVKLIRFEAVCDPQGTFGPTVLCRLSYSLSYIKSEHLENISGHLKMDVGPFFLKDHNVAIIAWRMEVPDTTLHYQIKKIVDAALVDIRNKI